MGGAAVNSGVTGLGVVGAGVDVVEEHVGRVVVKVRDGDVAPHTRFVFLKIASVLLVCGIREGGEAIVENPAIIVNGLFLLRCGGRAFGGESAVHFCNLRLVVCLQLCKGGLLVFALPFVPRASGCLPHRCVVLPRSRLRTTVVAEAGCSLLPGACMRGGRFAR